MFEIDPFQDRVKPTIFPPQFDARANKVLNIEDGSQYYGSTKGKSFDEVAKAVNSTVSRSMNVKQSLGLTSQEIARNDAKVDRHIMGQRQISKIYEGLSLLPQDILANADQLNSTFNYERVNDPDYVYLPGVLKPQYEKTDGTASLENQVYSQRFYDLVENSPGKESTSPHNLNLLHGIGSNPIKEGDTKNYERFQKSPYFKALHEQSMTPRNILEKLDPQFWSMVNDGVTSIEETDVSKFTQEELEKFKNPYGNGHFGLNWDNVADPYSDSNTKTFDITANFHTIVSSQLWETWDNDQIFSFVNRLWESSTRVDDVLREIIGKASEAPMYGTAASGTDLDVAAENARRTQNLLGNVDAWWDNVGHSLNEAEVLPFGLLAAFAPLMQTMKDWGNWADQIEERVQLKKSGDSFGFKTKMISGYLDHALSNYVFEKFRGDGVVTPELIGAENEKMGKAVYSDLIEKGYIDASGKITKKFDATDPNFSLGINFSEGEKRRVRDVLRQSSVGAFSLDIQDKTLVRGLKRSDIRIPAADGSMRTLPELIDLLGSAETPYDQVKNAQLVYDSLFDMHSVMTGLSADKESNGALLLKPDGSRVKLKVSTDGSWTEWDPKMGWVTRTGPVEMRFDTEKAANAFKDQIRILMALLEPVVGTFGPDVKAEGGVPFRMLIDNSGSAESVDMITDKSAKYRMGVDTLYDTQFFESQEWEIVANRLQNKVIFSVANAMFGRNIGNAMERQEHKRKKADYEAAKEEHELSEVRRIVKEMEDKAIQRQEEKEQMQRVEEEKRKIEAEGNKRTQEERARRAKQEKQSSKK